MDRHLHAGNIEDAGAASYDDVHNVGLEAAQAPQPRSCKAAQGSRPLR
jgi:hypothetical protein